MLLLSMRYGGVGVRNTRIVFLGLFKKDITPINNAQTFSIWKSKDDKSNKPSEEYQRFEKLVKALIAVPKSVIDKRQAEYEKRKPLRNERPREC